MSAADEQVKARIAIYKAITETVEESKEFGASVRAGILRDVAYAYRLASGGTQPGSIVVESK